MKTMFTLVALLGITTPFDSFGASRVSIKQGSTGDQIKFLEEACSEFLLRSAAREGWQTMKSGRAATYYIVGFTFGAAAGCAWTQAPAVALPGLGMTWVVTATLACGGVGLLHSTLHVLYVKDILETQKGIVREIQSTCRKKVSELRQPNSRTAEALFCPRSRDPSPRGRQSLMEAWI